MAFIMSKARQDQSNSSVGPAPCEPGAGHDKAGLSWSNPEFIESLPGVGYTVFCHHATVCRIHPILLSSTTPRRSSILLVSPTTRTTAVSHLDAVTDNATDSCVLLSHENRNLADTPALSPISTSSVWDGDPLLCPGVRERGSSCFNA